MQHSHFHHLLFAFAGVLLFPLTLPAPAAEPTISVVRLPAGAVQPSIATGPDGGAVVAFLKGDPKACDVAIATIGNPPALSPAQVLTTPQTQAVGLGTVRGPSLALGRDGVAHVLWTGKSGTAAGGKGSALFYSRVVTSHQATPPRDMMDTTFGLDGGAAIASDFSGNVWIVWHGLTPGSKGEASRRVFVRHSTDNGATFAGPFSIKGEDFGVCGCCGLAASANAAGQLHVLYRTARETTHRGIRALTLPAHATAETAPTVITQDDWSLAACPMTTCEWAPLATPSPSAVWVREYHLKLFGPDMEELQTALADVPPTANHPRILRRADGDTLLLWVENSGWAKAGQLVWRSWRPHTGFLGPAQRQALPVWSYGAATLTRHWQFLVVF